MINNKKYIKIIEYKSNENKNLKIELNIQINELNRLYDIQYVNNEVLKINLLSDKKFIDDIKQENKNLCIICFANKINYVIYVLIK